MQLSDLSAVFDIMFGSGNKGIGDVFNSLEAEQQKLILSTNLLDDVQKKHIVTLAGVTVSEKGVATTSKDVVVSQEIMTASTAKTATAEEIASVFTAKFATTLKGLAIATLSAAKSLAVFLVTNPIGWVISGAAAFGVLVGAIDLFTTSTKEAGEALSDTKQKFDDITSELDDMNDKLKSNSERIQELNELKESGTASLADKDELNRLEQENALLQTQIDLQKQKQAQAAKDVLKDTSKFFNAKNNITSVFAGQTDAEAAQEMLDNANRWIDKYGDKSLAQKELSSEAVQDILRDITEQIAAYQDLEAAGYAITGVDKQYYDSLIDIQDQLLKTEYRINQNASAYQALNNEQKKAVASQSLVDRGLSKEQADSVIEKLTPEELEGFYDIKFNFIMPGANEIDEAKEELQQYANEKGLSLDLTVRPKVDTQMLIDQGWDEVDSTLKPGDTATVYSQTYNARDFGIDKDESILVTPILPNGDVLTPEELEYYVEQIFRGKQLDPGIDINLGTFFGKDSQSKADEMGEHIHELHDKIFVNNLGDAKNSVEDFANVYVGKMREASDATEDLKNSTNSLTDATTKLNEYGKAVEGISNALATKKDSGFVTYVELDGLDDAVKSMDSFKEFANILGDQNSSMEDAQQVANKLATEYLNSKDFLDGLTESKKGYYVTSLEAMGVENAEAIVEETLAQKAQELAVQKQYLSDTTYTLANITADEINSLQIEGGAADGTRQYIAALALAKQTANGTKLNTSSDIEQLAALAGAAGGTSQTLKNLAALKKNGNLSKLPTDAVAAQVKQAKKEIQAAISGAGVSISTPKINVSPSGSSSYKAPSSSSSSSSEKDTTKDYDLIEIAISRVERSITNLGKTVSRTYIGWSKRNSALLSEMSEVNREIDLQQRAYDAYMNQAYASGLSQSYIDMFANGSISFFTTTDEALQKQIDTFKEYYDKALSCADAIEDLRDNLAELAKTKFDNVSKQFDNIQSDITHTSDMINAFMEQTEASGHIVSERYYKTLISTENSNIDVLKKKYSELNKALVDAMAAGNIEMYSEQWYEMKTSINEVEKAIEDAEKSLIEYNNEMRQIDWDLFDRRQNMISDIQEEANFLIEAMKVGNKLFNEDNGKPTEYGIASEGLHAVNYNAYMEQSKQYAEEIKKIDAELANDSSNTKLLDRREELIKQQREMIKNANSEKEAIKDLVEEGYNTLLDALQKLVEKRKEALSVERDAYSYEKTIREQTETIANLRKQYMALSGDNSEETQAKRQQLSVSLGDAETTLKESEWDQYIKEQEQMMDNLLDSVQEWINDRLDHIDEILQNVIDQTNANAGLIGDTIRGTAGEVGISLGYLGQVFSATGSASANVVAQNVVNSANFINNTLTATHNVIAGISNMIAEWREQARREAAARESALQAQRAAAEAQARAAQAQAEAERQRQAQAAAAAAAQAASSSSGGGGGSFFISKVDNYPKNKLRVDASIVDRLKARNFDSSFGARASYYSAMGFGSGYTGSASQNRQMLDWMKRNGYAKGSKNISRNQMAWTQEEGREIIFRKSDGAMLTPLNSGDKVFTKQMSDNLWNLAKMPQYTVSSPVVSGVNKFSGNVTLDIASMNVVGNDNPELFADNLVTAIQNNGEVQRKLTQLSSDAMLGRNSFNIRR